jgi:hypothetical protein
MQSGGAFSNVVVPAGSCTLNGVSVKHDVQVRAGGSLTTSGGTSIGHDLTANGASTGRICGTTIGHDLRVVGSTGGWTILDTASTPCGAGGGDAVRHDLVVRNSKGAADVSNTFVGHNLAVTGNTGSSTKVAANMVGHDAVCKSNTGQTDGGNSANHKNNGCG